MKFSTALFTALLFAVPLPAQTMVRVAAAADLQPVLPAIAAEYQKETGVRIVASFASSSTLATQILNGAPMDLFLSADFGFAQKVIDGGRAEESAPVHYASGTLVLWARHDSPALAGQPLTLDLLRSPHLHRLAVASAAHAPYGRAAMAALKTMHLDAVLQPKLVVAENIAQTAQFADTGNADAALISLTLAKSDALRKDGRYVSLPVGSYPPILQGAVVVRGAANADAARKFLAWLLTPAVQSQLTQSGLSPQ